MHAPRLLSDLVERDRLDAIGVSLDAPAVSDTTVTLSWGEYADVVARTAGALAALGVLPGDRVGVHLGKSVHSFVAVHAILRAGAVVVPVDPLAPAELASSVLRDAGAEVVITDARPAVRETLTRLVDLRAMLLPRAAAPGESAATAGLTVLTGADIEAAPDAAAVAVDPDDPAYIIYTSGSTGRPKGIVHTHRSALAYAVAAADGYQLASTDRMVNIAPLHFDQSTFELYASAIVGATVIVVPDPVMRFPASVAALVESERATVWYSVPHLLMQMVTRGALAERDLSSLRWILFGGEVFPPGQLAALMALVPSAQVSNVYGPAEVNQCTRHDLDAPPTGDAPVPIGRAWEAARVRVVASDGPITAARDVSPGEPGVLLVATETMMSGYWRRDDLTAAAILEDDGARWYVTGDLVVESPSGDLVFLGRVDNQVKIRGHRIELEAVDTVLADVDGVGAATAVVDRSDAEPRLIALIVVDGGQDAEVVCDGAIAEARRRLPRYAVPAAIHVVPALPRTSTGKVDRGASAELLPS